MDLTLYELKLILVIILCIPVVYFGVRFTGLLLDQALAGRKKSVPEEKPRRSRVTGGTDAETDDTNGKR